MAASDQPKSPNGHYPLSGCRVVEISQIWAGPQLCSSLGDMGAEVIRVESHFGTDMGRIGRIPHSEFRTLLLHQRHARSRAHYITINLLEPQGMAFFRDLIRTADVFACNLAPRVLRNLKITYDDMRLLRPDLVMATISAAGQEGPWSDLMAFGPAMNAVVGSDSLVGYPETGELMSSYWDPDALMGSVGAYAVLLALYQREATGQGQHIDLAFSEQLTALLGEPLLEAQMTGNVPGPPGNRHPLHAPHGIYPSSEEDTWVTIEVATEQEWQALCAAMGRLDLTSDPRFATVADRLQHREGLDAEIAQWTQGRTDYEAMDVLQNVGVAGVPAMNVSEIFHDPHDTFRRTDIEVKDPAFDRELTLYGIPWRLSKTPGAFQRLGQPMGGDNVKFFTQHLGLTTKEVHELEERKILH